MRELLAETIHLMFGEATFDESAGVHSRARVTLEENLVSAAGMFLATEEVVKTDFIE